jgi:hypothetical protein
MGHPPLSVGVHALTKVLAPSTTTALQWTYNIAIPHVDVSWATFWVAVVALAIAVVAAIYAKGAFKAAEDDLKISKANWEMATRTPKLAVSFEVERPSGGSIMGCPRGGHHSYSMPNLRATVWNTVEGKRRCDAFFIEVVVPVEALSLPEQARLVTEPHMGFIRKSAVEENKLFPGGGASIVRLAFSFDYAARAGEFELSYRMRDDYSDYPPEGTTPNGYLTTTVRLPIRPQFEFVNPRDAAETEMQNILSAGYSDDEHWHDKYTHAFELLDASGFKAPDERMKAAQEIAKRLRAESRADGQ